MKYIECLGIHGSGKTTVAQAFAQLLRAKRQTVLTEKSAEQRGGWQLFCQKAGTFRPALVPVLSCVKKQIGTYMRQHAHGELVQQFMVAHPHLMRNVVEGIIKLETAQFSSQRMLENFFQTAAVYQLAQRYLQEQETLLIEEGFCQQAYHVLASRTGDVSDDAIEEYLTLIPRPDYLLAVLTPPEKCEERLRTRKKYPRILDELSFSEKMAYLQCRAAFHQRIIASLERQWHIPIIEVPNIRDEHPRAYLEQFMQRQSVYF